MNRVVNLEKPTLSGENGRNRNNSYENNNNKPLTRENNELKTRLYSLP